MNRQQQVSKGSGVEPAPVSAVSPSSADIDALVARYAPVGRRLRRQRTLRRTAAALLVPLLGLAGVYAWQAGGPDLRQAVAVAAGPPAAGSLATDAARIEAALRDIERLKASVQSSVATEMRALGAQRAELAAQRDRMQQLSTELARQLAAVNGQRAGLAEQARSFAAQEQSLAAAVARVEEQRRQVEAQRGRGADSSVEVERQLAAIAREREALERQQQEFRGQSAQLTRELQRVNAQRLEMERQREAIEAQRAEVQGLLDQINQVGINRLRELRHGAPDAPAEAPAVAQSAPPEDGPMARLAAVDAGVLGEMRGGVDLGQDFAVAIGITRTGTINGVEQYSNTMYVEDLVRGGAAVAGMSTLDPVLLQSGPGNVVSADALMGSTSSVTTIIQNTLDNQVISNRTIMDISLQNVTTVLQGLSNTAVVSESLSRQP